MRVDDCGRTSEASDGGAEAQSSGGTETSRQGADRKRKEGKRRSEDVQNTSVLLEMNGGSSWRFWRVWQRVEITRVLAPCFYQSYNAVMLRLALM